MKQTTANRPSDIRIDKWLWHAHFFKSRSLAASLCHSGLLRRNGVTVKKPGTLVVPGDVLAFPQGGHVCVIRVLSIVQRRGSKTEAQSLYKSLDQTEA